MSLFPQGLGNNYGTRLKLGHTNRFGFCKEINLNYKVVSKVTQTIGSSSSARTINKEKDSQNTLTSRHY
jgi:hypothetical protein